MHSDHLVWHALSDPTRRAILTSLRERPRTTGDIAADFEMSRIAVMRHLTVLGEAELITSRKVGRQRWHYVNLPPLIAALRTWSEPLNERMAEALMRLKEVAERGDSTRAVDIAIDVVIDAAPSRVFRAITQDFGAWWGHPFLRPETTSLTLDAHLGGQLVEAWADGGQVIATVSGIHADRWLQMTGSFHLGVVFGNADLTLTPEDDATRVSLTFRGFGLIDEEIVQAYSGGWRELITVRLKRFIEEGMRLGIDKG